MLYLNYNVRMALIPTLSLLAAFAVHAQDRTTEFSMGPADELLLSEPLVNLDESVRNSLLGTSGARSESQPLIGMTWSDGKIQSHQGDVWNFDGKLVLRAGGAMAVDDATVTIIRDLKGQMSIETASGERHWSISPGNHGGFFAKSTYMPATGAWGWLLPVLFTSGGETFPATLYIAHSVAADGAVIFRKAWVHRALSTDKSHVDLFRHLIEPAAPASSDRKHVQRDPLVQVAPTIDDARFSGNLTAFLQPGAKLPDSCNAVDQSAVSHLVRADFLSSEGIGQLKNLSVDLSIMTGPSFVENDAVLNLFTSAEGTISSQIAGRTKVISFRQAHRGNRVAQSVYRPKKGDLSIDIPVEFKDGNGLLAHGTLNLACDVLESAVQCADSMNARITTTLPVNELFLDAGASFPETLGGADPNCTSFCPRCMDNSCQNCKMVCPGGGGCPTDGTHFKCCIGQFRCACRDCDTIPP